MRVRGFFGTLYLMRLLAVLLLLTALGATASVGHRFMSLFDTVDAVREGEEIQKQPIEGVFDETNWDEAVFQ